MQKQAHLPISKYSLASFGKILRRVRGSTPLDEIAERCGIDADRIARIEAGDIVEEIDARTILHHGVRLRKQDVNRLVLGSHFLDLGLKDNELRQLTIDLVLKSAPLNIQDEARRLYRSYTKGN